MYFVIVLSLCQALDAPGQLVQMEKGKCERLCNGSEQNAD